MSERHSLTAATLGAGIALTVIGLMSGPPPQTVDQSPSVTVQEDDPGWDCLTMGNRICGDPGQVHAVEAWQAWDQAGGWRYLLTDPNVENRVEYIGWAIHSPSVDRSAGYGAVPAPDGWYVFRAVPVDLATKAGA
jgi:hypothetical protein